MSDADSNNPNSRSERTGSTESGRPTRLGPWLASGLIGAAAILGLAIWAASGNGPDDPTSSTAASVDDDEMAAMGPMPADAPQLPPVTAIYEGQTILFVHTEASDQTIADTLTEMMGSPVVVVPSLADVPDTALAIVYVFANGIQPDGARGPLGYQPDVFDSVPGDTTYRPLRTVLLVSWSTDATPRLLGSVDAIKAAQARGEITIEEPGIVVNMPVIKWPGGSR